MAATDRIAVMRTAFELVVARLKGKFGDGALTTTEFRDNFRVLVDADKVKATLTFLKADGFDMLVELGAADYLRYPNAKDANLDSYTVLFFLSACDLGMAPMFDGAGTLVSKAPKGARVP